MLLSCLPQGETLNCKNVFYTGLAKFAGVPFYIMLFCGDLNYGKRLVRLWLVISGVANLKV
jgi:hypothetical protein